MFETPPREKRVMLQHAQPVAARHERMGELVEQDAPEEEYRRGQRDTDGLEGGPVGVPAREHARKVPREQHEDEEPAPVDPNVDAEIFPMRNAFMGILLVRSLRVVRGDALADQGVGVTDVVGRSLTVRPRVQRCPGDRVL